MRVELQSRDAHYFALALGLADSTVGLSASADASDFQSQWPPSPSRPWTILFTDLKLDGLSGNLTGVSLVRNGTTTIEPESFNPVIGDNQSRLVTFTWTQRYAGSSANGYVLPYRTIGPDSAIEISNARQDYSATQSTSVEAFEVIRIKPEKKIRSEFRARIIPVPANG